MIIGWIGMALLLLAYLFMISKWSWLFIPIDIIASFLLTIHAILLKDIPFIIVNGFVTGLLITKFIRQGGKKNI